MGDKRWSRYVRGLGFLALLGAVASPLACVTAPGGDDDVGVVQVAITSVPADVRCISITAQGTSRSVSRSFDVMPGASSVLLVSGIPTGLVTFTGNAFGDACAAVGPASVGTWSSDPVATQVTPGVVGSVALVMHRNGSVKVSVDFQDDGTGTCGLPGAMCRIQPDGTSTCCPGLACDPAAGVCVGAAMCLPDGAVCDPTQPLRCCNGFPCDPATKICRPPTTTPTCTDGVRNGTETDVDCGGPTCAPCRFGQKCQVNSDCANNGGCAGGVCVPPACRPPGASCMLDGDCCSAACILGPTGPTCL